MDNVPIDEAKLHLDELVERARRGEDVRIQTADGVSVKLQPLGSVGEFEPRVPGRLRGRYNVPNGLLDPLSKDELRLWNDGAD